MTPTLVRLVSYPDRSPVWVDASAVRLVETGHLKGPVQLGEKHPDVCKVHVEGAPPFAALGTPDEIVEAIYLAPFGTADVAER